MNKKGFTLMEVLTVIIVITVIMMIVLPSLNSITNHNKDELYESYEKMMVEYALVSSLKGREVIKLSELDGLKDNIKEDCKGYVKLVNNDPITYKAYIKCSGQKNPTNGYNDNLAG